MNYLQRPNTFLWGVCILFLQRCGGETLIPNKGCTEISCTSGYVLFLQPEDSLFQQGRYDVHLTPEGEENSSCIFVVTNNTVECASGYCVTEESCNARYLVGYINPDRVSILYPVTKTSLVVEVERDDVTITRTTFIPIIRDFTAQRTGVPTCMTGGTDHRVCEIWFSIKAHLDIWEGVTC